MKQILLLSHGGFAKGMLDSIQMIAGSNDTVDAMCIQTDTNVEDFKQDLYKKCESYGDCDIIIVSDIAGGSTTQCALTLLDRFPKLYLICGCNLALVLELLFLQLSENRNENEKRIKDVISSNQKSICLVEVSDEAQCLNCDSDDL